MATYENEMNQPRGTTTVTLERGNPDTNDYLRVEYPLPEPYTTAEYCAALDDFNRRYDAGERTAK